MDKFKELFENRINEKLSFDDIYNKWYDSTRYLAEEIRKKDKVAGKKFDKAWDDMENIIEAMEE